MQLVISRGYNTNPDLRNGPPSGKSTLRLFGYQESDVRVTLYRDHNHIKMLRDEPYTMCPHSHSAWLWLEENRIPYRVEQISRRRPMITQEDRRNEFEGPWQPAVKIDGNIIEESEVGLAIENLE